VPLAFPQLAVVSPGTPITSALWMSNVYNGLMFLANPPLAVLYQASPQSIPNNAFTPIQFDASGIDTYAGHSNTTNNSRYTSQLLGWYEISGVCGLASNTTGARGLSIFKNGVQPAGPATQVTTNPTGTGTNTDMPMFAAWVQLDAGDYVELQVLQGSGGALSTVTGVPGSVMTVRWMHA
jgi:hypothetical protein